MLLSTVASVLSAFLFAQRTLAALTPQGVVDNIKIVTTVSANANIALSQLSTRTSVTQVRIIGQTLSTNFNTIIVDLSRDVTAMRATHPFADGVTQPIVAALKDFVIVHQVLLSTVIGKHGIFAQFGVTAPIAGVLRTLEAGIDGFAFAMIDLIPTRQADVKADKTDLDQSVGESIALYEKFCIPSIFYPTVMPTCF